MAHRLMDRIDEFRELRGGHSMVADVLADDLGCQIRRGFVGVHHGSREDFADIYGARWIKCKYLTR